MSFTRFSRSAAAATAPVRRLAAPAAAAAGLRAPLSSLRTSVLASGRATARRVVHRDERNVVEARVAFAPYPEAVAAALRRDERQHVDDELPFHAMRLDPQEETLAWAVLAGGRDIVVWHVDRPAVPPAVFEADHLEDDEVCDARLVCVVRAPDGPRQGLLAVSPSGRVRYWPDALDPDADRDDEAACIDIDLAADVTCVLVEPAAPVGPVIATNAATLYQIAVQADGSIACFGPLARGATGGVISGLVSWVGGVLSTASGLVVGTQSDPPALSRALIAGQSGARTREVYLLSEAALQKWLLTTPPGAGGTVGGPAQGQLLWHAPLRESITRALLAAAAAAPTTPLRVWLCDARLGQGGRTMWILAASTLAEAAAESVPLVSYSVIEVDERQLRENPGGDGAVRVVATLELSPDYDPDGEYALLEEIALAVPRGGPAAYVASSSGLEAVWLDLPADGGGANAARRLPLMLAGGDGGSRLIGYGARGPAVLLFSSTADGGILSVSATGAASAVPAPRPAPAAAPLSAAESESRAMALMRAFCAAPPFADSSSVWGGVAPPLDLAADADAVLHVSRELADEPPSADARWAEDTRPLHAGGGAGDDPGAVLLGRRLAAKAARHAAFVTFTDGGSRLGLPARWSLLQNGERLAAALALRTYQNDCDDPRAARAVLVAILRVAHGDDETGAVDRFYTAISAIESVVPSLWEVAQAAATGAGAESADRLVAALAAGEAAAAMLAAARDHRLRAALTCGVPEWVARGDGWPSDDAASTVEEFGRLSAWTTSAAVMGALRGLVELLQRLLDEGIPASVGPQYGTRLAGDRTAALADVQLALCDHQLDGLRRLALVQRAKAVRNGADAARLAAEQAACTYEDGREWCVRPFIARGDRDRALALAEAHRHHDALIELCVAAEDATALQGYAQAFADDDFEQRVFQWLLAHSRRAELLNGRWGIGASGDELAEFLVPHPELSWVHAVGREQPAEASATLQALAVVEDRSIARKKTLLSLAKLCALAAGDGTAVAALDDALYVVRAQQMLFGEDESGAAVQRPLGPAELVAACAGEPEALQQQQDAMVDDGEATAEGANAQARRRDAADRHILAHEVVSRSVLTPDERRALSIDAWRRTIMADAWRALAAQRAAGTADDAAVLQFARTSLVYAALRRGPAAGDIGAFLADDADELPAIVRAGAGAAGLGEAASSPVLALVMTAARIAAEDDAGQHGDGRFAAAAGVAASPPARSPWPAAPAAVLDDEDEDDEAVDDGPLRTTDL